MARRGGRAKNTAQSTAEAYKHKEKEALLRPDVGLQAQFKQKRPPKTYQYDPSLDPQLVWAGKAERAEFSVLTLPLFVHERLSTQAILQTLKGRKRDKQQNLFADVELDLTDRILKAYVHKAPWVNRMILGDSLVVMNSLLQYEGLGGQIQMIYMDPPYGVKFGSNFQPFVRKRDVKHGDDADLTREPEMVQAYRDTWELGLHSYLTYLRDRLLLCRELLHPSGSIFVQISDENLHHVRELLDELFGAENFMGMIVFVKTTGKGGKYLDTTTDNLLWFTKDAECVKYRQLFTERSRYAFEKMFTMVELPDGICRRVTKDERESGEVPHGARLFKPQGLFNDSGGETSRFPYKYNGNTFLPPSGYFWRTNREGLDALKAAGRLIAVGRTLAWKQYETDFPLTQVKALWTDTMPSGYASESSIYVVQTSTKVVARCLLMTTDAGDLVLDPTCGSGTTAYVAEQWGRRWITMDVSRVPLALARQRLLTATFPWYTLQNDERGAGGGFVYKRKQNAKGEEVGGIVPH
ncbi:MAG: site-specific DNA-methyltransferase, partial [Candidatus Methylomirabilales bacterium]